MPARLSLMQLNVPATCGIEAEWLMAIRSAGILLYRRSVAGIQVLLAHPGGPFWSKRDRGSWSIPKGVVASAEKAEKRRRCASLPRRWANRRPAF
ncbi:hypothetical protein [Bosea sp. TND4EK4]|uniref:hypothetical protein n=1 Tax=Bosea sp. TND4EK4 TaxID=1907408 RepID=UPI000954D79D|nr:hypothetical protein SAMN05880592_1019 [Bosea sp. TND4EK4]